MLWSRDPFREFDRLQREMDRMFSRMPFFGTNQPYFPLINMYDAKDDILIIAEIPGVRREDVSINMRNNTLTISGNRKANHYGRAQMLRQEQPEGDFERTINLPVKIRENDISAKFEDGILKITLPKSEEAKPRRITIQS